MEEGLHGRVAVVTGAGGGPAGGIGAGIARVLAASGATVAVNDMSTASAEATVAELRAADATAEAFVADISSAPAAIQMCGDIASRFGGIDVLVNCAGVVDVAPIEQTTDEAWSKVIAVNLTGSFYTARAAVPHLKRSDAGRIIFISSIAGIRISTVGNASYTASKAGMLGLMRHLAAELAGDGITSNAVLPGGVRTPLLSRETAGISESELFGDVPLGRGATTAEIGEAVAFLASPRAAYITGAELVVDGGRSVLPGAVEARHRRPQPPTG